MGNDADSVILTSNRHFCVERRRGITSLNVFGNWTNSVEKAASKYPIKRLELNIGPNWVNRFPRVIERFPHLTELSVSSYSALDWSCIERLSSVRRLCLNHFPEKNPQTSPVNLGLLRGLTDCVIINWQPAWASLSEARKLKNLILSSSTTLANLDCRKMLKLEHLSVYSCPNLKSIEFPKYSRVRKLRISHCAKLEVSWQEAGRSLREIFLEGRLAWPIADLVRAKRLERLTILGHRTLPSLSFLRHLPALTAADIACSYSTKDRALVHSINLRNPSYAKKLASGELTFSPRFGARLGRAPK